MAGVCFLAQHGVVLNVAVSKCGDSPISQSLRRQLSPVGHTLLGLCPSVALLSVTLSWSLHFNQSQSGSCSPGNYT